MSPVLKYYLKTILLGFALTLSCGLIAQNRGEMRFAVRSLGFPEQINTPINKVVQDTLGFYWLFSWAGLYRFDGQKARFFDLLHLQVPEDRYFGGGMVDVNGMFWYYYTDNRFGGPELNLRVFDPYQKRVYLIGEYLPDLPFDPQAITWIGKQKNRIFIEVGDWEVYEFGPGGIQHIITFSKKSRVHGVSYYSPKATYFLLTSHQLLQVTGDRPTNSVSSLPKEVFSTEVNMASSGNVIFFL